MKKTLLLLASAALLFAGCAKEMSSPEANGDTVEVSFTAAVPGNATKATIDGDGAAAKVDHWLMVVFDKDGNVFTQEEKNNVTAGTLTQTFGPIRMVKNQTYQVVFWADTKGEYTITTGASNTFTVKPAANTANKDSRDAFTTKKEYTSTASETVTATLYRPFAQLNVITTDLAALNATMAKGSGVYANYAPTNFKASVKIPQSYNVFAQTPADPAETAVDLTADSCYGDYSAAAAQTTLFMDYIFASADQKDLVDVAFSFKSNGADIAYNFTSVPLQKNYRTNILGDFLSNTSTWTVTIDPAWIDEENVYPVFVGTTGYKTFADALKNVEEDGIVSLANDVTISSVLSITKSFTIKLNGHSINEAGSTASWAQVTGGKTLTIDGEIAGSAIYGRLNLGKAGNDNGSVIINGGTYACGAGQTVLHINGECLASNVTINNATFTSADDNGIQLNGAGTFTITNSTFTGATGVYIKSGVTTLTGCTITGNMTPVNYSYNGNGANPTGDGIVVDACEYPGGDPVVKISNCTISGTKSAVGYYQYDGNKDGTPGSATIISDVNTHSVLESSKWIDNTDEETKTAYPYALEGYVAKIQDTYYKTLVAAVEAANDGQEVSLLTDVALEAPAIEKTGAINISKAITLDGKNHKVSLKGTGWTKMNNGAWDTEAGKFHVINVMGSGVTIKNLVIVAQNTNDNTSVARSGINLYSGTGITIDNVNISYATIYGITIGACGVTLNDINVGETNTWGVNVDNSHGAANVVISGDSTRLTGNPTYGPAGLVVEGNGTETSTVKIDAGTINKLAIGASGTTVTVSKKSAVAVDAPSSYIWGAASEGYQTLVKVE